MKNNIDFGFINDLYMSYRNERDIFAQRRKRDEIKRRISPYELLMYSGRYSLPLKAFREIFTLDVLFSTLEEMQRQGEDISRFTQANIVVNNPDDVHAVSAFAKRKTLLNKDDFCFLFFGNMVFECGDFKSIGENFNSSYVNNLSLEQLLKMANLKRDFKGIPIIITINNMGELPLDKLAILEQYFDIDGIKIQDKDKEKSGRSNQGESTPLNLNTYKRIRAVVDDIIQGLYVNEKADKMQVDFQLATQIIDRIAQMVEYDHDAAKSKKGSIEVKNASGMVGLLTGKAICKGYSEILRNVMSCANIECSSIEGISTVDNQDHSWNQVKLGDNWFNVDLTFARKAIREGKPSGDLFMSDIAFFGDRKTYTFEKDKVVKGKNVESTVNIRWTLSTNLRFKS